MKQNNVIEYLELSAGLGKTYTTLKWVVDTQLPSKTKWLYVGKNIELIGESESLVNQLNPDIITDSVHYEVCKGGVLKTLLSVLEDNTSPDMLFICHETLCNLIRGGHEETLSGWNVIIDEMLEVFSIVDCKREKEHDTLFDSLVCLSEEHNMYTSIDGKSFRDSMYKDANNIHFGSSLAKVIDCISNGSRVYIRDSSKTRRTYTTYNITPMRKFITTVDRCIMLGARIKNTLHANMMERQGVVFKPFLDVVPERTQYLNQERVSIYYLTSEKRKQGCTQTFLETAYSYNKGKTISKDKYKHFPNGIDDLGGDYITVYQELVERSCELLGKDFIYTVNYIPYTKTYREVSLDGVPRGRSVPYACHGWNHLKHYTKALCLFCYKPSTDNQGILNFLSIVLDYPNIEDDFIDENYKEASYQTCTRSAIRDFSNITQDITFVVPDKSVAEYIQKHHIPNCIIKDDLVLYVPDKRENNGGHNKGFAGEHLVGDSAGKKAYGRFKKKYIKDNGVPPSEEDSLVWLHKRKLKQEGI